MKLRFLLLLPILIEARPSMPPAARVTFSPLTKAAYLQAKKSCVETKPRVTFPLKKVHGQIVIPTEKGRKVFTDIIVDEAFVKKGHSEGESREYTYLGYLPDYSCHLLRIQYYETTKWLLVSSSGQQSELWGEPLFSPDMKHIASSCMGIEYGGGQPNIIQVLALKNGSIIEAWSLKPKDWEPYRLCWTSNSSLLLRKEMWIGKHPGTTFTYAKLLLN